MCVCVCVNRLFKKTSKCFLLVTRVKIRVRFRCNIAALIIIMEGHHKDNKTGVCVCICLFVGESEEGERDRTCLFFFY